MSLEPGSPEWLRVVTASKVAAIVGVSPWESPLSMWHKMSGNLPDEPTSAAMSRGNLLEGAVLDWWMSQHPEVDVAPRQQSVSADVGFPALATLDMLATTPDGPVIVEAKTSAKSDEWGEPGTDEIPAHYLAQVYWQLAMCPEALRAYVALLGPFLEFSEYVIERDDEIIAGLVDQCRRFYESLGANPPPLDDHVATVATLRKIHPEIDRGGSVEIDQDVALAWLEAKEAAAEIEAEERQSRAFILNTAKRAQYITHNGHRIARRQAGRGGSVNLIKIAKAKDLA